VKNKKSNMIVANTKPNQLISIKNSIGVCELYLITKVQDNPLKVRAYKQLRGGIVHLDRTSPCEVVVERLRDKLIEKMLNGAE
jgi:hypothetical protein|tara:strand:+ start:2066 stop:2314 length:249 start_codon:yes stop_codon:yes gene_type:complete